MKTFQFNYFDNKWPWGRDLVLVERHGLGFIHVSIEEPFDFGFLHDLVVHEDIRGKGLGRQLLEMAENTITVQEHKSAAVLGVVPGSWMDQWYRRRGYTDFIEGNPIPYRHDGYITLIRKFPEPFRFTEPFKQ